MSCCHSGICRFCLAGITIPQCTGNVRTWLLHDTQAWRAQQAPRRGGSAASAHALPPQKLSMDSPAARLHKASHCTTGGQSSSPWPTHEGNARQLAYIRVRCAHFCTGKGLRQKEHFSCPARWMETEGCFFIFRRSVPESTILKAPSSLQSATMAATSPAAWSAAAAMIRKATASPALAAAITTGASAAIGAQPCCAYAHLQHRAASPQVHLYTPHWALACCLVEFNSPSMPMHHLAVPLATAVRAQLRICIIAVVNSITKQIRAIFLCVYYNVSTQLPHSAA